SPALASPPVLPPLLPFVVPLGSTVDAADAECSPDRRSPLPLEGVSSSLPLLPSAPTPSPPGLSFGAAPRPSPPGTVISKLRLLLDAGNLFQDDDDGSLEP
ncbi:unnamed protein product, partial [Ectocarpus sp. 13 AM-2016]